MAVEKECLDIELKWKDHSELLEKDIEKWKKAFELEKTKTEKLREHLTTTTTTTTDSNNNNNDERQQQ
jgi:hypothetical protein